MNNVLIILGHEIPVANIVGGAFFAFVLVMMAISIIRPWKK
jgi:hypothetical protein